MLQTFLWSVCFCKVCTCNLCGFIFYALCVILCFDLCKKNLWSLNNLLWVYYFQSSTQNFTESFNFWYCCFLIRWFWLRIFFLKWWRTHSLPILETILEQGLKKLNVELHHLNYTFLDKCLANKYFIKIYDAVKYLPEAIVISASGFFLSKRDYLIQCPLSFVTLPLVHV